MKYLRFLVFSAVVLLTAHCSLLTAFAQGTTNYPASLDDTASLPIPVDAKVATLTVNLTSAATTATVNSTSGFSAKGVILIESEEIAYTGTTGTTFTGLTRGFGGTTARPHSINMQVKSSIVAAHITGGRQGLIEVEKKVGIGACNASAASTNYVLTKQGDGSTCWAAPAAGGIADPGGANDDFLQRKAGAWAYRTIAQVKSDLNLSGTNTGDQDLSGYVPNTRTVNGHALSSNVTVTPTDLSLVIGTNVEAHDADLTTIGGLTPTNDDVLQRKAGAWINRTTAQLKTDLVLVKADVGLSNVDNTSDVNKPVSTAQATADALNLKIASNLADLNNAGTARTNLGVAIGSNVQAWDADLDTIAGLAATTDNFIVSVASAWASRTPAQVKTTLSLNNLDNTSDANKPVSTAQQTALDLKLAKASNLSDLSSASTSRTNLGVAIGSNVQAWDADLDTLAGLTPTTDNFIVSVASAWASRTPAQVKTTLSLNNLDNTSDANKPVSTAQQTALDLKLAKASNLSDLSSASTSRTNLGVAIGSNVQAWDADLDTIAGLTATTDNFIVSVASAWASRTPAQVKTTLSLNNVENTALSTWAGTANITTLGTIGTGTWQGGVISSTYGGTGVNNAGRTLTINTNNGILAFGASGTHTFAANTGTVAELNLAQTWSAQQTFTSPKILTDISDTNGNELFKVTATGSAVNEITVANAATGGAPSLTASGGDSNIDLTLASKGTGGVKITGSGVGINHTITARDHTYNFSDGNGSGFTISAAANSLGMNRIGLSLGSDGFVGFTSTQLFSSSGVDAKLSRAAANVLEINNGSVGGLGKLLYGRVVTAKTSNYTVLSADKNTFFTNTAAAGTVNFTLPTAAAGLTYEFYIDAAQTLTITAGASTTIRVGASVTASAGNVTASTVGNKMKLVAISTTQWVGESVGTWTFN